ncbi:MAG: protoglobin family protein [Planctomycetota bacterium]|nr:protoglobin family protein [Planctomycetota bacterium]
MKQINEPRLESDLAYRFQYLTEFMGFGPEDIATIKGAAPLLAPLVPVLVDAVYAKLYTYDATWRHFLPRQHGYEGVVPDKLADLTPEHPQIQFRKQHLAQYLERLVTGAYDGKMVEYLDVVGKIHTNKLGSKDIHIPLVQMNALMGFVADALNATILGFEIPFDAKVKAVRAFSKLLWLQNDLIVRHYAS